MELQMPKLKNTKIVIEQFKEKHGDTYDYSLVEYVDCNTKVTIICPKHGEFQQRPSNHLSGSGCLQCGFVKSKNTNPKTNKLSEVLSVFREVHGDTYDYSLVEYKNNNTKVTIICPKHGEFQQKPRNHAANRGCPACKQSKGNKFIREYLEANNIEYIPEARFKSCFNKRPLPFDFYVPYLNLLIEYDGIQHYRQVNKWGGIKNFYKRLYRDHIKTQWAEDNNYKLLRIPYYMANEEINEWLDDEIKRQKL